MIVRCLALIGSLFIAMHALSGCSSGNKSPSDGGTETDPGDGGLPDSGLSDAGLPDSGEIDSEAPPPSRCRTLSDMFDVLFCAHEVTDTETWQALSVHASRPDMIAATKYVFSTEDPSAFPLSFLNAKVHQLHYNFLVEAFPEVFETVSPIGYLNMAMDGLDRTLMVGIVYELVSDGEPVFGFTVLDDTAAPDKVITESQVKMLYDEMKPRFTLGELVFFPDTTAQAAAVEKWSGAVPVRGQGSDVKYEVYTAAEGFGTVRMMSLSALQAAVSSGAVGYQDILVLDEAPSDLETIVSGTVTGTRQGVLSHLNVRSAARGTPNCYIPEPRERLSDWEGKLVKLTCDADELRIESATLAAAEAGWDALKPAPVTLRPPDTTFDQLVPLLEMPTETAAERERLVDRIGSKAANLAVLYQRIDSSLRYPGFGIPFHYYQVFMAENRFEAETSDGLVEMSFGDAIADWLDDEQFLSDTALRRERLLSLQAAMKSGVVDGALLNGLDLAIREVWGSAEVMVRFRSSSNAEDALSFSGAGLYDSTSACLADQLDGDSVGPSRCDPDKDNERDLARALRRVWASLWNPAAFEERTFYGIDHRDALMGILVNTRTKDETANIVAFTGNPVSGARDYLINAQLGEWDVVSSSPGIFPETTLLEMADGEVAVINRVSESSQTAPGEVVLTDERLNALGAHLAHIENVFPVDVAPPTGRALFFDTEWKLTEDDVLIVKQIRPFLH